MHGLSTLLLILLLMYMGLMHGLCLFKHREANKEGMAKGEQRERKGVGKVQHQHTGYWEFV